MKFYHLVAASNEDWFKADRLRYDLGFREWQDDYDATTRAVRNMMWLRTARVDDFSPVLMRALSLFGPGELRALHVTDVDVLRLVTSLLRKASSDGTGSAAAQMEQVTDALCVIHAADYASSSPDVGSLAALLERHTSTMTELDADLPLSMLNEAASALACCTRLESLTRAYSHDPGIWLGLSQLHTLRGVDLSIASFAVIAAALPKLHTLMAFGQCENPASVADFFMDLLPRLWVFHFYGGWPEAQEQPATSTVPPLPLLEELIFELTNPQATIAPREFLGAQPTVLRASYALISKFWLGAVGPSANFLFLARVCELHITTAFRGDPLDQSDVARVLRAAPQLKKFHTTHWVQGDASWLAPTAPTHPAFEGLIHPRLRVFGIVCAIVGAERPSESTKPDAEWVAQLRRRHFPRLRELLVGAEACFVTPAPCISLEVSADGRREGRGARGRCFPCQLFVLVS
jgi:hypothetical protein